MIMPSPLSVLVVDDDIDSRCVTRWLLKHAFSDVTVYESCSKDEIASLSDADQMSLIFLNTGVEGFESVCALLSQYAEGTVIPLIVVGDVEDESARSFGQLLGHERWISNDELSVTRLRSVVRDALRESALLRSLNDQSREVERLRAELERQSPEISEEAVVSAFGLPVVEMDEPSESQSVTSSAPPVEKTPSVPTREQPELAVAHSGNRLQLPSSGVLSTGDEEDAARQLQADLLPGGSPLIDGFEIAGLSVSARSTGGDYYDYLPTTDGLLNITIGECSGHGLAPTMLITSLRAYLRVLSAAMSSPSDIVSHANRLITEDIGGEEFLVTLMLVQIDQLTRRINYASAGHQSYLLNRDGESQVLHSTGMPMGLLGDTIIPDGNSMKLRSGEMLLLLTDGAQKMTSESGERFGVKRVLEFVCAHRHLPLRMIVTLLRDACLEFAGSNGLSDDITFVMVRASGSAG